MFTDVESVALYVYVPANGSVTPPTAEPITKLTSPDVDGGGVGGGVGDGVAVGVGVGDDDGAGVAVGVGVGVGEDEDVHTTRMSSMFTVGFAPELVM